jgi:hypothetical protein
MKTPFTTLVLTACAALLAGFAIPHAASVEVVTAPAAAAPLSAAAAEQYLVLDTSRVPVGGPQRAGATLESILNDYGAQGWRVRTTMSPFIILAR